MISIRRFAAPAPAWPVPGRIEILLASMPLPVKYFTAAAPRAADNLSARCSFGSAYATITSVPFGIVLQTQRCIIQHALAHVIHARAVHQFEIAFAQLARLWRRRRLCHGDACLAIGCAAMSVFHSSGNCVCSRCQSSRVVLHGCARASNLPGVCSPRVIQIEVVGARCICSYRNALARHYAAAIHRATHCRRLRLRLGINRESSDADAFPPCPSSTRTVVVQLPTAAFRPSTARPLRSPARCRKKCSTRTSANRHPHR